jgi:hypothetical protein
MRQLEAEPGCQAVADCYQHSGKMLKCRVVEEVAFSLAAIEVGEPA